MSAVSINYDCSKSKRFPRQAQRLSFDTSFFFCSPYMLLLAAPLHQQEVMRELLAPRLGS